MNIIIFSIMRTFSCIYSYNTLIYILPEKELGERYRTFERVKHQYCAEKGEIRICL